ncbi:hypothetical protein ACFO1B_09230 [Dactylosporangium siamense]|uniref:HEAT repeat domain-containing protein n=1 Tax=Dactylosporangium siamense TaxID=685454 RepID=A0A919PQK5_9ACTN|nr:hypothetical protein [Dactylosporangium siamense]GIG48871.1 hypothetical protein Dsi01nite_069120 [Dactylosporangium siamense]
MRIRLAHVDDFDWRELQHAFGSAEDAPRHLEALLRIDVDARGAAVEFLRDKVSHDLTIYSAALPALLCVSSILDDPRIDGQYAVSADADDYERPLRAALLDWIRFVVVTAVEYSAHIALEGAEHWPEGDLSTIEGILAARSVILPKIQTCSEDPAPIVRRTAAEVLGEVLGAPELAAQRGRFAVRLTRSVRSDVAEARASAAFILDRLGISPAGLLRDEHPGVRACAAVSRTLDEDPAAIAEVQQVLADHRAIRTWFSNRPYPPTGTIVTALERAAARRFGAFSRS